jgi:putative phosphoribosyl transferase
LLVRKVQIPWNTEAGFGAVTMDDETVLNEPLVAQLGLTREVVEESILKTRRIIQGGSESSEGTNPCQT